jgi:hypothetical protein
VLIVVSPITVDGNQRSWVELTVRRRGRDTGGHRCQAPDPSDGKVERRDRWVTSSAERSERSLWRVSDGDWHVDVWLGSNVSYDTATIIVRAIRRRTLVNQLPAMIGRRMGDTLPTVDAGDIGEIEQSRGETGVYEVRTGQRFGYVLDVSVVAGQVLVQNLRSWIS